MASGLRADRLTSRCSGPVHRGSYVVEHCANSRAVARPAER